MAFEANFQNTAIRLLVAHTNLYLITLAIRLAYRGRSISFRFCLHNDLAFTN